MIKKRYHMFLVPVCNSLYSSDVVSRISSTDLDLGVESLKVKISNSKLLLHCCNSYPDLLSFASGLLTTCSATSPVLILLNTEMASL